MWPWPRRPHWSTNQSKPKGNKSEMAKADSKRGRERGEKVNNNAQHNLRILPLKHSNDENTRRVGALYHQQAGQKAILHAQLTCLLYTIRSLFPYPTTPPLCFPLSFSLYLHFAQVSVCTYLWRTRTNDLIPVVVSNCKWQRSRGRRRQEESSRGDGTCVACRCGILKDSLLHSCWWMDILHSATEHHN